MSIKLKQHISTDVLSHIAEQAIVVGDDFIVTSDLVKITVTIRSNGDLTLNHTLVGEGLSGFKPTKESINAFLKNITERLMPSW
jgi:hypothetical protein